MSASDTKIAFGSEFDGPNLSPEGEIDRSSIVPGGRMDKKTLSSPISIWLFLATFCLIFYGMGASFVESFVNYPTWPLIGANEFRDYHRTLGSLIIGYMVIPMLVGTFLTFLLITISFRLFRFPIYPAS